MLNGGSIIWGFCVYFVYMIPLETDVLRKHRFQKSAYTAVLASVRKQSITVSLLGLISQILVKTVFMWPFNCIIW